MTRRMRWLLATMAVMLLASRTPAQDQAAVIMDMDTLRYKATEIDPKEPAKGAIGEATLVDEGKIGKAVKFSFKQDAKGFMTLSGPLGATPDWDAAAGISMWVKGDGSKNLGAIEFIDQNDYKLRYDCVFPIDGTEWTKVTLPWRDFIPVRNGKLIDPKGGYAPSKFGTLWFGKWYYWRDLPAHSYAIDQIALEKSIDLNNTDYTPKGDGLARVRAKIAQKKPLTIVTMGDSLSDKRHWANRQVLWSELLVKTLKEKRGVEAKLVNPAIGGTALSQNIVLMPIWLKDNPSPDMVTIWFGFNDWDNEVRGELFKDCLRLAVDRVRRLTKGSADVVLMTTTPAYDRWETMKELEQAAREVAAEKKCGLVDMAEAVRQLGTPDDALKAGIWVNQNGDRVHLGARGHQLASELVLKLLAGE